MKDKNISTGLILKLVGGAAVLLATTVIGCTTIERVEAQNVGIKVRLTGGDKDRGVQGTELCSGYVWFNPLTEQIVEFPTKVETVVWTQAKEEGSPADESITFSSKEGVSINTDISLSFRVDPTKAAEFYIKFRQTDLNLIAHGYVRNVVREAFNNNASKVGVEQIYGAGKTELINKVIEECRKTLSPDGFIVEQITLNSQMRLPQNIVDSINNSISATQHAIAAENKVREIEAEAKQVEARAKGAAEAAKAAAQGQADSMLIEANGKAAAWKVESTAQAEYNRTVGATATPALIQYKFAERWNGQLPQVSSAGGVINNLPH